MGQPIELTGLIPGTALDAGCGAGAEALWLAEHGWQVGGGGPHDLGAGNRFDLVTTHYAHPAMPQLDFYSTPRRLGGTRRDPADRRAPADRPRRGR